MKRVIVALLMLLSAAAAATVYVTTDNAQRLVMQHAASIVGQPFTISGDPRLADPNKMFAALRIAAADRSISRATMTRFIARGCPSTLGRGRELHHDAT